jgi:hypothetical protein
VYWIDLYLWCFEVLIRYHLNDDRDISIQVLGYWFWWLFIVPSLRSRKPKGPEKKALDIAFLGTPIVSALAPVVTKDTGLIWFGEYCSCVVFRFSYNL